MNRTLFSLLCATLLASCASNVPDLIRTVPANNPDPAQVLANEPPADQTVRWGGVIAAIENRADETWVEVVSRRLSKRGRPLAGDQTQGRFLAVIHGFVDPAIYAPDRHITVAGTVDGKEQKSIGEFQYVYPVVRTSTHYLWQPLPTLEPYPRYPVYYDPWYYHPPHGVYHRSHY